VSLARYAKRRDEAEAAIIAALERAGCSVLQCDHPDLIVGRGNQNYLLEVKRPGYTTADLTPAQKLMLATWNGQYAIVTSPTEAAEAVGLGVLWTTKTT
jgi:hypothetical protein